MIEPTRKGHKTVGRSISESLTSQFLGRVVLLVGVVAFFWLCWQVADRMMTEIPRHLELLEIMQTPMMIVGKVAAMLERYQLKNTAVSDIQNDVFDLTAHLAVNVLEVVIEQG